MGKCKTKAIQTDLGTFKYNQAYPGIIQMYSGILRTLTYLEPWHTQNVGIIIIRSIFRTLTYLQPWYIQNCGIFRTMAYLKSKVYSEPCQTFMMKRFVKIGNGYNYFRKLSLFSQYKFSRGSYSRGSYS